MFLLLMLTTQTDTISNSTNKLLFIDNHKLLAKDGQIFEEMKEKVKKFMRNIGLEINEKK
ncbi:hypothetical protein CWI36_3372p0010 [Hamiltosporidium magnivora]|uniref:Reverse transcriptase domain-containing protein n=1 Tax=Hamiltosporidium magnivora TaxID=148818 RepID=A0A4Q9KQ86_9MICR|nr:hypothetical protein CWI36_3372p0010 [Hamiltosporidium magnivora]